MRDTVPGKGSLPLTAVLAIAGLLAGATPPSGDPAGRPLALSPRTGGLTIALLPLENRSGGAAPLASLGDAWRSALQERGISLLNDIALRDFMRRVRMRYTGGLGPRKGAALAEGTWANAALVTSLDLYDEAYPPRLALSARLVTAGGDPRILWIDSTVFRGDEAPGFMGLGLVDDFTVVQETVLGRLADSLAAALSPASADGRSATKRAKPRFRPSAFYRAPAIAEPPARPLRIAVLPFANDSTTKRAGEIVTYQVVRHLVDAGAFEVIEPGVVREALLQSRLIQQEGLSLPQVDLVRLLLNVDVALFGEVTEYREGGGATRSPEVAFSARAIDTASRQLIWASNSHRRGDDGVFFFGTGGTPTAHGLASELARALVETILPALGTEETI